MNKENIEHLPLNLPEELPTTDCVHHWVIETPNGPTSPGVCKNCPTTKTFLNYEDTNFGGAKMSPEVRKEFAYQIN